MLGRVVAGKYPVAPEQAIGKGIGFFLGALAAVVLLSACFEPKPACDGDHPCPSGAACVGGRCVPTDAGGDAADIRPDEPDVVYDLPDEEDDIPEVPDSPDVLDVSDAPDVRDVPDAPDVSACPEGGEPSEEVCNGLDDDCDGEVDEDNPEGGDDCGSEVGECRLGVLTCVEAELVCEGGVGPVDEVCDGLDNDCDSGVDEGTADTGGVCGIDEGECSMGILICDDGELACFGEVIPEDEVCDGLDNDCDGQIDEGLFCPPECRMVRNVNGTGLDIEFCTVVPAGVEATFWMGCREDLNGQDWSCSDDELGQHPVTFSTWREPTGSTSRPGRPTTTSRTRGKSPSCARGCPWPPSGCPGCGPHGSWPSPVGA